MLRRRTIPFLLVALLLAGGGAWVFTHRRPSEVVWQGYAEADYVKVGPVLQGLLTQVSVARGDEVSVSTPLFTQDEIQDHAARDQAARQYGQAQEQLANLLAGGKPTEIHQAEGNLADARATLTRAEADFQRGEKLLASGYATEQNVDQL